MKYHKRTIQLIIGIALLMLIYIDMKATPSSVETRGPITIDLLHFEK